MRLIDADELISKLHYRGLTEDEKCWNYALRKIVKEQPVAYDFDKVVDRLKNASMNERYDGIGGYVGKRTVYLDDAIEIVKHGGVSDDACEWKYNDEFEFAKSECGAIDTKRIAFRKWKYCPYCGKKIKVVE